MNIYILVFILMIFFYVLTPGILVTIPPNSSDDRLPVFVHTCVFGIVTYFLLSNTGYSE